MVKALAKKCSYLIPDKWYLALRYRMKLGKWPNLKNPKLYTEKVQWLKLYDRKPKYINMVDKYEAKQYISDRVGNQYVIPTYGVWDKFEDIDFDSLPDRFVLKCTHNSGGVLVCKDKKSFNLEKAKIVLDDCMKGNYYWHSREWPYKNVKPRIIAEEYLEDESCLGEEITDYKFICFDGEPKILFLTKELSEEPYADCYDMSFQKMNLRFPDPNSETVVDKPSQFEKMKEVARKLSKDMAHLRVDFYDVNGKLYVGELTFYHCAGIFHIQPKEWDKTLGDWITLPKKV